MRFFLLLMMISPGNIVFAADKPGSKVRASLDPGGDVWVGQRMPLVVELLVPGYFSGSPAFDLPRVPGLLILPPAESPTVGSEQEDGITYAVQRHELTVFSRRPGMIAIPPFEIRFSIKRQPLDKESVEQAVKTTAIAFTAKPPPGSQPGESLITSGDLMVKESWKPEPAAHAKAGNAFVRTIVWTASDVPGMAFPPFDAGNIDGLGIYPGDPLVNDTSGRGVLHGERRDKVTYVCKTGGHFVIPELTLRWWDLREKEIKQVVFPARSFDVAVPPVPPVPMTVRVTRLFRDHWPVMLGSLAGVAVFALAIRHARESIVGFLKRLLPRHLTPLNPS